MSDDPNENLTDVVQNLPDMAAHDDPADHGTVVSSDGTVVTLGEEGASNTSFPHTD
jgi:hypothetical protein